MVRVKLIGEDGNVYNVIGRVAQGLRRAGLDDDEFVTKAMRCESYDAVLQLAMEYVEVV